eukprot:CAMPEP_0118712212 /NCGR_PEP_ID=MMETSP0800-20121206/24641_1 /TAXON_ID=210618 ORGANISM="Striatella unipunctata, Strain CCMP2910" /NCGR_SAMPLE_ID=MMETSP0800 /ASSEMBLY_ACC=CAM_ASM_000638 /LENGTH=153 /DNA_ID=CAMNT_0006617139 /DNA_START=104 /DNA_END=565 /DNA_ORIENTATION=-
MSALSPKLVWSMMEGVEEPLTNPYWVCFFFLTISVVTPLMPSEQPPLFEHHVNQKTGSITTISSFVYPPIVVNGLPWWFVKLILASLFSTVILLVAIVRMPHEFPTKPEEEKEEEDAEDPVDSVQDVIMQESIRLVDREEEGKEEEKGQEVVF